MQAVRRLFDMEKIGVDTQPKAADGWLSANLPRRWPMLLALKKSADNDTGRGICPMKNASSPTVFGLKLRGRMTVTAQIWAGLCFMVIAGIVLFSLWWQHFQNIESLKQTEVKAYLTIADTHALTAKMLDVENSANAYIIAGQAQQLENYQKAVRVFQDVIGPFGMAVADQGLLHHQVALIAEMSQAHIAQLTEAVNVRRLGGFAAATRYLDSKPNEASMQKLRALTNELIAGQTELLGQAQAEAASLHSKTIRYLTLGIGIAFLILVFSARTTVRRIRASLQNLVQGVYEFGSGNLSHRIPVLHDDEFGLVAQRINGMALNLAFTEIERQKIQRLNIARSQVLEMIAAGAPLSETLDAIVRGVEQENPQMMCSVLLLEEKTGRLLSGAAPSLPTSFTQSINGMEIGMGVGSCGTAAFTKERVVVEDIQNHPYWARAKKLAARSGLGACWSEPIRSSQGKVLGTFAIYHAEPHKPEASDIQLIEQIAHLTSIAIEKDYSELELRLAASVFSHAREGIFITDCDGNIIDVNEAFIGLTGYSRDELIGKNSRILRSTRHPAEFYKAMWKSLLDSGHWSGEIWNRCKDGHDQALMITISAVRGESSETQNYVSLLTDITAIKDHQRQLEHIAHFDALTSLPNRVLLANHLRQAMAQSQRRKKSLAVAYLDLDGFKSVNDTHGHDIGDELLVALSNRMKNTLRDGDTLARIGGDEFIAVLGDIDQMSDCEPVLIRLLKAAADPVLVRHLELKVSASIGVTLSPQDEGDVDQLIRHADQAMYVAKQRGKNRYHLFDIDRDVAVKTQHESIESIQCALELNEFRLHFQPKVNLRTGQIIGAEALIRWQHPEQGLLMPGHFLPVIEDHPLSIDIGEWVISAALKQMTTWRDMGLVIPVSVNIGAYQLQQQEFVSRLLLLMSQHPDVPPGYLELEVLETSGLEDIARVVGVMQACQEQGIGFALDDFGTGYSSLTYLRRLPVSLLKVDQSFVRNMLETPEDYAIVEGVIGLANAFRRQVIAEGVETAAHGKALMKLGCDLVQGYGIARPMPPEAMPDWVKNWQPGEEWVE